MALFAAVGHLSLAVTALLAGRRSPLARPLAALCFVLFGWNFASLGRHVFGGDAFALLDSAFTALSPPLVVEVILTFVGGGRRHRKARAIVWLAFGTLAAASIVAPLAMSGGSGIIWLDGPSWAAAFLCAWAPTFVFQIVLIVRHLAQSNDAAEKARTRTVLAALAIGATFSTSDIVHGVGVPLPYLGSIGTLIAAGLLATCAMRFGLFDRNVSTRTTVSALGMIGAFVVAYLVIFRVFAGSIAAQAFTSAIVTLLVVAVARELGIAIAESRARVARLTVLGRFSAQMAHDLRSPLAALMGAVQVLEGIGETPTTKERATRKELLELAFAQAKRMSAIVDRYDRMGRIELRKTVVRIEDVILAVARAHDLDETKLSVHESAAECDADRDLFESAVENVVRNALEATRGGGDVRVHTARNGSGCIVVRVIDTGPGMDARLCERAFEDFFTTRETGSGLGLAFARRVMVAHGGDVTLKSELGVGTTVELTLPAT